MCKKKVISCTGYGGTGSSAVTSILMEYENIFSFGDSEFWFLQGYNGISDLEHFLIDGNHRSKVNLAIKRFFDYVEENKNFYNPFFNNSYEEISKEYISSLIDADFQKSISQYEVQNKILKSIIFRISPFFQKIIWRIFNNNHEFAPYIPKVEKFYSIPNRDRFYQKTKEYTDKLFQTIQLEDKFDTLLFDQLVPSINTDRYFNYLNNLKVIIVDRDPRDLFLSNELYWKGAAFICDTKDIYKYINWYKTMRKHRKFEIQTDQILKIKFEDLIINYEKSLSQLNDFLNLKDSNHKNKAKYFNPKVSSINVKIWEKNNSDKYHHELKIIEKELGEYCYE